MPKVRKTPWVDNSRKGIVKGKPLNPSAAIEQRYYLALQVLIDRMTSDTEHELQKLFKTEHAEEFFAQDASVSSQARILTNALIKKYTDLFASLSKPMAEELADQSDKASDIAVKSSIRSMTDQVTLSTKTITSGPLADILNATVTENVALIKSIPAQYLGGVQQAVMRSITTGNGMQELVPYLQKHKGITLRRARFICQDQTKKAMANLSFARLKKAGIASAIWRHTSGSRHPRQTHIHMDGETFLLSEGLYDSAVKRNVKPGELPGCACRAQPILSFDGE
ncbi:phage head morphogenesis protein [Singulisphaera rosea]